MVVPAAGAAGFGFWPALRARRAPGVVALLLSGAAGRADLRERLRIRAFWNEFACASTSSPSTDPVYTREVVGNIRESHALGPMFAGIAAATLCWPRCWRGCCVHGGARGARLRRRSVLALAYVGGGGGRHRRRIHRLEDSLGQRSWCRWPKRRGKFATAHNQMTTSASTPRRRRRRSRRSCTSWPRGAQHSRRRPDMPIRREAFTERAAISNVVMVSIESLRGSSRAWAAPGSDAAPRAASAREGLFFTQMYATGTRSIGVRGLEALTLSVLPTPATPKAHAAEQQRAVHARRRARGARLEIRLHLRRLQLLRQHGELLRRQRLHRDRPPRHRQAGHPPREHLGVLPTRTCSTWRCGEIDARGRRQARIRARD